MGLASEYKTNDDVKQFCGMLDGVAFLPVADITEGQLDHCVLLRPAIASLEFRHLHKD